MKQRFIAEVGGLSEKPAIAESVAEAVDPQEEAHLNSKIASPWTVVSGQR
jgi:hypothetical protein